MTITYEEQKYVVEIIIPSPYNSIKLPNRKIVGVYDTLKEAEAADNAAILTRDIVIKTYVKYFKSGN